MSKQSVKPVLLSEAQIQAIRKIQEKQRQQSGIGVAPTIHEIARGWSIPRWPQFLLKQLQDCRSESNAFL
ncbi:hypothetical protein LNP26_17705 [Klebsiella variicola subsp. variicola]|nr:hypothetical protein [Klebsiella variicola subsp. variicola]